ncbi:MAG: extracellular solute-binding protein [Clostridia bacterium]|nr:extracellular solute-binding protein [Clostridia bacterium]
MKRRRTQWLGAIVLGVCLAGCHADTATDETDAGAEPAAEYTDRTLVVWYDTGGKEKLEDILWEFEIDDPEITVTTEDYSDLPTHEYRVLLEDAIRSGGGTDVIVSSSDRHELLQDMDGMICDGCFLALDTLGVDLSACNAAALRMGYTENAQYLLPLNYGMGFLLTTEERISQYGIVCGGTLEEFASSLAAAYADGKLVFSDSIHTGYLFRRQGQELVSARQDEVFPEQLRLLADCYDRLYPEIFVGDKFTMYQTYAYSDTDALDAFLSGELLFLGGGWCADRYDNLQWIADVSRALVRRGETPYLTLLPTADGSAPAPNPGWYLMVNANTENRDAAACFLQETISMRVQYKCFSDDGIPVSTVLMDSMREHYSDIPAEDFYSFTDGGALTQDMVSFYFDTLDAMPDGIFSDTITGGQIHGIFRSYLTGSPFDEAFDVGMDAIFGETQS